MKINRKELVQALSSVSAGLSQKEVIEQTTSFVFRDGLVFTFNDEIAISCPVDVDFEGAVPAKEFLALINKLGTEDVELDLNGGEVRVKGSRAKAGIRLESEIKLPIDDIEIPEEDEWRELPLNFCDAMKSCMSSVSKDQTKPVLMCIHIKGDTAESTDNYRATRYTMEFKILDESILIPASSAKEIIALSPTECGITKGWLHFRNKSELIFSCRVFKEDFPSLDYIIINKGTPLVFPNNMEDMLDKATTINDGKRIVIALKENVITVKSKSSVGWFEESAKMKYKEKPIEFEIHPDYLEKMLKEDVDILLTGKTLEFSTENSIHIVAVLPSKE